MMHYCIMLHHSIMLQHHGIELHHHELCHDTLQSPTMCHDTVQSDTVCHDPVHISVVRQTYLSSPLLPFPGFPGPPYGLVLIRGTILVSHVYCLIDVYL